MLLVFVSTSSAWAQEPNSCAKLTNFKAENVEITKAAAIAAGTTEAIPWNQTRTAPLPAYCRVEGVMNRRTGIDGEEFGITFALAMPDQWNGDFLMQGGAGSNGVVVRAPWIERCWRHAWTHTRIRRCKHGYRS